MRRHIWRLPAIACALFFLTAACDQSPGGETKTEECRVAAGDVIQPLTEGTTWTRSHPHFNGEGEIEPEQTDTSRVEIERRLPVAVAGTTYAAAVRRETRRGITHEEARLLWNGPEGVYTLGMVAPGDTLVIEPTLRYKYPVVEGESWPVFNIQPHSPEGGIAVVDTLTYTAVRTGEPFVTPADTFETVVYHSFYDQGLHVSGYSHYFEYYAPGVGLVGMRAYYSPDTTYAYSERNGRDLDFGTTLLEYCLK